MHFINKSTTLSLFEETIEQILFNTFEVDCIDIVLTQQKDIEPLVLQGPGTIFLDKLGTINLKMYVKVDVQKVWGAQSQNHIAGKILAKDHFFALTAIDGFGREWTADHVSISQDISYPTNSVIIKADLNEIKNSANFEKQEGNTKNHLMMIIPGEYKLPCNEWVELSAHGRSLSRLKFSACGINFEFEEREKYLLINADYDCGADFKDLDYLIREALSIILGDFVKPKIIKSYCSDVESVNIRSQKEKSYSDKNFPTPYRYFYDNNIVSLKSFFEKYISKRNKISTDLIGFWFKIYKAWQSGLENVALPLTVSIEGMVKTYLSDYGLPDTETLNNIKDAEVRVENIDWSGNLRERLLSSLGYMKNPTVKGALEGLCRRGAFPVEWVSVWSKLRNRSAHADKINPDKIKLQKFIDDIYCCFALYYRILFLIMGHEGKYTNYSQTGWPESDFIIPNGMK